MGILPQEARGLTTKQERIMSLGLCYINPRKSQKSSRFWLLNMHKKILFQNSLFCLTPSLPASVRLSHTPSCFPTLTFITDTANICQGLLCCLPLSHYFTNHPYDLAYTHTHTSLPQNYCHFLISHRYKPNVSVHSHLANRLQTRNFNLIFACLQPMAALCLTQLCKTAHVISDQRGLK